MAKKRNRKLKTGLAAPKQPPTVERPSITTWLAILVSVAGGAIAFLAWYTSWTTDEERLARERGEVLERGVLALQITEDQTNPQNIALKPIRLDQALSDVIVWYPIAHTWRRLDTFSGENGLYADAMAAVSDIPYKDYSNCPGTAGHVPIFYYSDYKVPLALESHFLMGGVERKDWSIYIEVVRLTPDESARKYDPQIVSVGFMRRFSSRSQMIAKLDSYARYSRAFSDATMSCPRVEMRNGNPELHQTVDVNILQRELTRTDH